MVGATFKTLSANLARLAVSRSSLVEVKMS